jgi:Helix-loop-helix DNA-binding domain
MLSISPAMVFSLPNDASPPSSEESTSTQADSPPDWSQFSSLWDGEHNTFQPQPTNAKFDPTSFDFALNLPLDMDLDFNPSLAVDPAALHFNPNILGTTELSSFSPQQQVVFPPRRMSITSSSSSGASFSPILDATVCSSIPSVPSTTATSPNLPSATHVPANGVVNDPVADLAQSVRQAAGVTLAVPVQGQAEHLAFSRTDIVARMNPILSNGHELDAPKLPIPRLQRPSPPASTGSKLKSPGVEPNPSVDPSLGGTVAVIGRPKTSHTTIERRYRTNLNARIQSLKDAVPALRVLETKEKAKKSQDTPEAESEEKPEKLAWNDLVDERGFVDGVKVARKISKANVLGKAAEYIQ